MRMRPRLMAIAVALLMVTAAACGSSDTTDTTSGGSSETTAATTTTAANTTTAVAGPCIDTVKIGVAYPLTGPSSTNAADLIQYAEYGLTDAAKELAAQGITLEWVLEDTVATAETGVQALNRLANVEHTPIVVTAYSAVVNAIAPLAEDLGVALVNIGAQSPNFASLSKNLINFYPLADVQAQAMANYLRSETDVQTAGAIYIDNEAGIAPAESFLKSFEAAGGTSVGMEPVAPNAPDASIPVAKLLANNPEAIWIQTLVPEAPPVFQAIRDGNPDVLIVTHEGLTGDVNVREAAGDNLIGTIYTTLVSELPPGTQEIMDRFRADLGREPGFPSFIPYYYDFGFFVKDILLRLNDACEPVTGENFLASVRDNPTVETPLLGETTFRSDLTVGAPITIKEVVDPSAPPTEDKVVSSPDS